MTEEREYPKEYPKELPTDEMLELMGFKRSPYCKVAQSSVPKETHYVRIADGQCWNLAGVRAYHTAKMQHETHVQMVWDIIFRGWV